MCSAFHARSAHHLRSIHHARGHIMFRGNGTHRSKKRLLSDDKRRFWWCGRWDLNPHVYGWTQAPQACLSTYSSTPASSCFLDAGILYRGSTKKSSFFSDDRKFFSLFFRFSFNSPSRLDFSCRGQRPRSRDERRSPGGSRTRNRAGCRPCHSSPRNPA